MLPPSHILTFHWMKTNIMQIMKLKVSDMLLLLPALALKHCSDGMCKEGKKCPYFDLIVFWSIIFRIIFHFENKKDSLMVFLVCCLVVLTLYRKWYIFAVCEFTKTVLTSQITVSHEVFGEWWRTTAVGVQWPPSYVAWSVCEWLSTHKQTLTHAHTVACTCIIIAAHPLQHRGPCAFNSERHLQHFVERSFPRTLPSIQICILHLCPCHLGGLLKLIEFPSFC